MTRQSFTLGLVATYLVDPFFAELARGIQEAGERHGYLVYLTSSEGDRRQAANRSSGRSSIGAVTD